MVKGGPQQRGRAHETLVNNFSKWLIRRRFIPARNQAIDVAVETPPVIFEAEVVGTWTHAVREAVGQLYEYRYWQIADPKAALVFLASKPVPDDWLHYLESDRGIGTAWPKGAGFELSRLARKGLGI